LLLDGKVLFLYFLSFFPAFEQKKLQNKKDFVDEKRIKITIKWYKVVKCG